MTDNLLLAPEDFTEFNIVGADRPAPAGRWRLHDDRLLRRGADASSARCATSTRCRTTTATQFENWNGVDVTVNARLRNGLTLQGGVSTGKTMEDNCEIVAKLPEMNNISRLGRRRPTRHDAACVMAPGAVLPPRVAVPDAVQGRTASTLIPKIEVQVSGSFRSIPGRSSGTRRTTTSTSGSSRPTRFWPPTQPWAGRWRGAPERDAAAPRALHGVPRPPQRARSPVRQGASPGQAARARSSAWTCTTRSIPTRSVDVNQALRDLSGADRDPEPAVAKFTVNFDF